MKIDIKTLLLSLGTLLLLILVILCLTEFFGRIPFLIAFWGLMAGISIWVISMLYCIFKS